MLPSFPKFKRNQVKKIFEKLPKSEQKLINDYLFHRQSCGLQNVSDLKRVLIQIRHIIECDFGEFKDLNQHTRLVVLIKNSYWSGCVKSNMKINLNNFFGEFLFPDLWTIKFKKVYSNKNQEKFKNKIEIPTTEEFEKMLNLENSTFFKAFLLTQEITGCRTGEMRLIEIPKITFNKDETSTIEIYMTKIKKYKVVFTDKQTTFWIKKLIKEYEASGRLGKYLFQSKNNPNEPISKNQINYWFKELSLKATGKHFIPYSLRHKKATQLYILAKNNKIAESTALKLMGHSKSQMQNYDHTPKDEDIKILKEQAFNIDVSPEKKHELEIALEKEKQAREKLEKEVEEIKQNIKKFKTTKKYKISQQLTDDFLIKQIENLINKRLEEQFSEMKEQERREFQQEYGVE